MRFVFSRIWTVFGKIWTRKNSVFGLFSRSASSLGFYLTFYLFVTGFLIQLAYLIKIESLPNYWMCSINWKCQSEKLLAWLICTVLMSLTISQIEGSSQYHKVFKNQMIYMWFFLRPPWNTSLDGLLKMSKIW